MGLERLIEGLFALLQVVGWDLGSRLWGLLVSRVYGIVDRRISVFAAARRFAWMLLHGGGWMHGLVFMSGRQKGWLQASQAYEIDPGYLLRPLVEMRDAIPSIPGNGETSSNFCDR